MTSVYVLRHPETTWNVAERYQGRLESTLTAEGCSQARALAGAFAGQPIDAVYSSPLKRAIHLAAQVADTTGAPLQLDQRLTEIGQLPWEGLWVGEIRQRYGEMYRQWHRRPDEVRFPEGEALHEVRARALSALGEILRAYPGGQVVMVTHSVVVQALAASALCLDLQYIHRIHVANASVMKLEGTQLPGELVGLNWTGPLFPVTARDLPDYSATVRAEGSRR